METGNIPLVQSRQCILSFHTAVIIVNVKNICRFLYLQISGFHGEET